MKAASYEILTSSIDEKTLAKVLKEREKRLKKLGKQAADLSDNGKAIQGKVYEDHTVYEESKVKKAGRIILKTVSVAAVVVLIAAFAYICYLPIYMQNHGMIPPAAGNEATNNGIETAAVTADEVTSEITSRRIELPDSYFDRTRKDRLTVEDHENVKEGMTFGQICDIIGKPTGTIEGDKLCLVWDVFGKDAFLIYFSKNTDAEEFDPYNDLTAYYMMSYDFQYEVTVEVTEPGESEPYDYRRIPDELTDITHVKIGMSYQEAVDALDRYSYSTGLPLMSGAALYVNDRETGHMFYVIFDDEYKVSEIRESGIDVDYIAPEESLGELYEGMPFDEVVGILGRPLYMPTSGVITMFFRVGDADSMVLLSFVQTYKGPGRFDGPYCALAELPVINSGVHEEE